MAASGSLYPDHVIFLGPAATTLPADAGDRELDEIVAAAGARGSKLFLVPGAGALFAAGTPPSADELALCLALVLERVPDGAELSYLTAADEAELLDWDAEKDRQALAGSRGAQASSPSS